jgi:hypothetical protein
MSTVTNVPRKYISRRTQSRIFLQFPLEVSGKDQSGHAFVTLGQVRNVSSVGGCMTISKDIVKGETLRLVTPKGDYLAAKVCWSFYNRQANHRQVGFYIIDHNNEWTLTDIKNSWFFHE